MAKRSPYVDPPEDAPWTIAVEFGPDGKARNVVAVRPVPLAEDDESELEDDELEDDDDEDA
jgi:hypothetical protein